MRFSRPWTNVSLAAAVVVLMLFARWSVHWAGAQPARFHLEEATIADVHRAIRARQITATQLVQLYLKRIEAYNGICVKGDVDPATGLMLGDLTPLENAGQRFGRGA